MGTSTTSLRRGRAILAWLVLYVVGLFAQGAHVAFERHEVCEHGEAAHVESAPAVDTLGPDATHEGEHARAQEPAGDGEHHHCGIAVASPVIAAAFSAPAGFDTLEGAAFLTIPPGAPRVESIARLRLAPHHSPPRSRG